MIGPEGRSSALGNEFALVRPAGEQVLLRQMTFIHDSQTCVMHVSARDCDEVPWTGSDGKCQGGTYTSGAHAGTAFSECGLEKRCDRMSPEISGRKKQALR